MKWRAFLLLLIFALLAGGYWWLDKFMASQAWAVATDGQWRIAGSGWETLKHAWPVALIGTLIGGGAVFALVVYLFLAANDADHKSEINRIKAQKALSDQYAADAQLRAEKSLEDDREALREQRMQLQAREEQLCRIESEAAKRVQAAEKRANEAEKLKAFADTKKERATYTLRKLRRKMERLSGASEGS